MNALRLPFALTVTFSLLACGGGEDKVDPLVLGGEFAGSNHQITKSSGFPIYRSSQGMVSHIFLGPEYEALCPITSGSGTACRLVASVMSPDFEAPYESADRLSVTDDSEWPIQGYLLYFENIEDFDGAEVHVEISITVGEIYSEVVLDTVFNAGEYR